jgi:hypothetical protein
MSRDSAKRLRDIRLVNARDGREVRLGDLWFRTSSNEDLAGSTTSPTALSASASSTFDGPGNSTTVLCIFRRFGCPLCRLGAAAISSLKPFLEERGVLLVGIGVSREGLEGFLPFFRGDLLLIDQELLVYKALALQRNSWRNLWGLLAGDVHRLYRETQKRRIQGESGGDVNQLGATIILQGGTGQELYLHRQANNSYEPDITAMATALCIRLPDNFDVYGHLPQLESQTY